MHLILLNLMDWDVFLSSWHMFELYHNYFVQSFSWENQGEKPILSGLPYNAIVMSCHRSCGWFPSDSRGTVTVVLSAVLIGAGMSWGKCLHLTLSPPFSDSVGTDYLNEGRYRKKL